MSIVCQLLVTYQPGGLAEKELPPESANLVEAVQSLRRWSRGRRRAADLQISEPDPFLLLKGLNRIVRKPLEANRDLTLVSGSAWQGRHCRSAPLQLRLR